VTLLVRAHEPRHSSARRLGEVLVHALELDSNVALDPRLGGVSLK
jgi:hypothetical protein